MSLVVNAAAIGMKCVGIVDYKALSDQKADLTDRLLRKVVKLTREEKDAIEHQVIPTRHLALALA